MNLLATQLRKSAQSNKKIPNNITGLTQMNFVEHIDVGEDIDMDPDAIIENMNHFDDDSVTQILLESVDLPDDRNT